MRKHLFKIIVVLCVLAVALIVIMFRARQADSLGVYPKRGPIVESVYGIGTVTSRNIFNFKVGLTKTILRTHVREGDAVTKGQLLIELSDGVRVLAPFNGTVTSMPFNAGENVGPETIMITVQDLKERYVLASLEQMGALRVKQGLQVKLSFESIREQIFSGLVKNVFPQKGQFMVTIDVEKLPDVILPGMTSDISIEINRKEDVLLVPVLAVSRGSLLIDRGGKQMRIPVQIGSMDSEWAEVLGGDIQVTDKVLTKK